jgi:hypothetical protein
VNPTANDAFSEGNFELFLNETKFYFVCTDYEIEFAENITVDYAPPMCPKHCDACYFEDGNDCEDTQFNCTHFIVKHYSVCVPMACPEQYFFNQTSRQCS